MKDIEQQLFFTLLLHREYSRIQRRRTKKALRGQKDQELWNLAEPIRSDYREALEQQGISFTDKEFTQHLADDLGIVPPERRQ